MPACPTARAAVERDDDSYLPNEALCPVHNLTYNAGLNYCPSCMEEVRP